eukprot:CAMPEP_0204163940 /NCGR_PEP_ID=MMETSP0361-20130328/36842_1 /ASSEMBLY_ACC=CAM_ASM_000343 /TAXON_ID=268821 /ORGANISM="Scrippsiella Hangoei, Strain SHTV-5" /LENGTH=52 /DNA_ID=CAMNT_0051120717 /DNA_START=407 /DNA_END=562 /DNA_ORIENTATION=+
MRINHVLQGNWMPNNSHAAKVPAKGHNKYAAAHRAFNATSDANLILYLRPQM